MADPAAVEPVKRIVALLWSDAAARAEAMARMVENWGGIDHAGTDRLFDDTTYYADEMGPVLHKRLLGFAELTSPGDLAADKLWCTALERDLAGPTGRRVNVDVGYLDHNKVVLASLKYAGQKIYLADGIYADLIARYMGGRYRPFDWTFPDYRAGRYDADLVTLRALYMRQRRSA